MTDDTYPDPNAMAKIDGAKVRRLREVKGLTQLYLATFVGVTTDTVSRWENKRYQTIKQANAMKLAEALEVSIEDILDQDGARQPTEKTETRPSTMPATRRSARDPTQDLPLRMGIVVGLSGHHFRGPPLFLSAPSSGTVSAALAGIRITAERYLPDHCAPKPALPGSD